MGEKNDYIPVSNTISVASRNDSNQSQFDQNRKKKEEEKKPIEIKIKKTPEQLDTTELIEFGRIVLNKRNTELKLFSHQKSAETNNPDEAQNTDIALLQVKIANYEKDIQELDLKNIPDPTDTDLETQIDQLEKLFQLYVTLSECIKAERKILNIDDIDQLDDIILQKDDILNHCDKTRNMINFSLLNNLPEKSEIRIKSNAITADIKTLLNDIIQYENENSIELQNVREKMKLILSKQDKGVKTITQYIQTAPKSHFIDKKQ